VCQLNLPTARCFLKLAVSTEKDQINSEFKIEAVRLVRDRGVSVAQAAARDLDVHVNVLRKWIKDFGANPTRTFPGHGNTMSLIKWFTQWVASSWFSESDVDR
jgi:transposase-like protein